MKRDPCQLSEGQRAGAFGAAGNEDPDESGKRNESGARGDSRERAGGCHGGELWDGGRKNLCESGGDPGRCVLLFRHHCQRKAGGTSMKTIHFVGAGSGAADLITLRGKQYLEEADTIIYAGSLVNPQLLDYAKAGCSIYNSAHMTLEEVLEVMRQDVKADKQVVRLHTGDPCLYGAIREQMDVLDEECIPYDYCPGVSSFCGAASALNLEYTLPNISQSVIITRMAGRTPVPEKESIESFAAHHATMVVFLSTGLLEELSARLIAGGYSADTPAAIVYKATWEDEKSFVCTVGTLAETAKKNGITKTALMIIGDVVSCSHYDRSKLYDPGFTTEFREASK